MTYDFRPLDWTHVTNIYEVNVRQYTKEGTFKAFASSLPRLRDMGVDTLWFMPITPISQKNRKGVLGSYYAAQDYTSVNAEFGTLDDFRILVKQAHEHGFKVIVDWVANHTGWDHRWTIEHPDYYEIDSATGDFKRASGMDDIIELDFHHPGVAEAMIDAMKFWITECDIDGFRCDLAFWVELDFWRSARNELDAVKPLFWLGELDPIEHPEYMSCFDAAYTWKWMHKAEEFYQQKLPAESLLGVLNEYSAIGDASMRAWFTSNHDENSWNGTEYEKYGDMALPLAVFCCMWNGLPLVYSGQELPNLKRIKFFEKDEIIWTEHVALHDFYKTLFALRATHPALRGGDANCSTELIAVPEAPALLAFIRGCTDDQVAVFLNFSSSDVDCTQQTLQGKYKDVFSDSRYDFPDTPVISLSAWQYRVLVRFVEEST